MPICAACEVNFGEQSFSRNQLFKDANRRCSHCVNARRQIGHARQLREAEQRRQAAEAEREAAERERVRLARIEQEERERREAEEREERERQERARRDAAREERLNQRIMDVARMERELRAERRQLIDEISAMPAAQQARLTGPVTAGLLPMDAWSHETSLSWWDDTFAFSDLYRDRMRDARVDGSQLALIRDSDESSRIGHLYDLLCPTHELHVARVSQELVTHVAGASAASSGAAGSSGVCVVCVDQPAERALLPCGHLCLCQSCCTELMGNNAAQAPAKCPICRSEVQNEARIFLVASDLAGDAQTAGSKRQRLG